MNTKENLEKTGIVKITETDGGMYQRRLHTYTYNNKLLGGHGYGFGEGALIYRPETDFVLIEDTTGMSLKELQEVYPNKYYSYYDV
tara:strand:- start:44 stop:301 length:258 start_codon:yes stop_codon:yes gene_type:complete